MFLFGFSISDRLIRHRACALKDTVHAIIKDELDENFEKICVEIKESHLTRGSLIYYSPGYIYIFLSLFC